MRTSILDQQAREPTNTLDRRRRLRIGIFTDGYPPVVNGVSTSVHTLVEQLELAGHLVYVFAPRFPGFKESATNVLRFPSMITPFDKRYPIPLPFSPELINALRRLRLDVVHSQSPFVLGLVALELSRRNKIPLVATNHTLYLQYTHYVPFVPKKVISAMAKTAIGWYYRSCEAVIAPSRMAAGQLRDQYDVSGAPVHIVPSGIPIPPAVTHEQKMEVRRRWSIPLDSPIVLYSGRLAREKNLMMLLDAFENGILAAFPDARLILAGSGPDEDAVKERARSTVGLEQRVVFTGFLNREELDPIYAAADVFAFTSKSETQGMVVGEALASGTPCVVVDEGGAPEAVDPGVDGIRVPDDPELFAHAVVKLLKDDALRNKMGAAGRLNAEARTPGRMTEKVIAIYEDSIAQVKKNGPKSIKNYKNIRINGSQLFPLRRLTRRR